MIRIALFAASPLVILLSAGGATAQTDAYRDHQMGVLQAQQEICLLYTSPSPRDS